MATSSSTSPNPNASNLRDMPLASDRALTPIDWVALALVIVGGLNWGLVGLFEFDLVARLFGTMSGVSRAVYILVALGALWTLVLAFRLGGRRGR